MKRIPLSWRTKHLILERDNYTCVNCGFTKINTSSDIPKPFKSSYLMFITFESIISNDRLARVLDKVDDGGAIEDIVLNWQDSKGLEIDHIHAVCNGGHNGEPNLQCLCTKCHRVKTNKDLEIYSANQHKICLRNAKTDWIKNAKQSDLSYYVAI